MCALWYTRDETRIRQASTIRLAVNTIGQELPYSWFQATCDTPDEARARYEQHVAHVAAARSI